MKKNTNSKIKCVMTKSKNRNSMFLITKSKMRKEKNRSDSPRVSISRTPGKYERGMLLSLFRKLLHARETDTKEPSQKNHSLRASISRNPNLYYCILRGLLPCDFMQLIRSVVPIDCPLCLFWGNGSCWCFWSCESI